MWRRVCVCGEGGGAQGGWMLVGTRNLTIPHNVPAYMHMFTAQLLIIRIE